MIRGLILEPASVLHRRCSEVRLPLKPKARSQCSKLSGTLRLAPHAAGLAAPQLGILQRIVVVRLSEGDNVTKVHVLVNPELEIDEGAGLHVAPERCLSLPGVAVEVERWVALTCRAVTPDGRHVALDLVDGEARLLQHEVDHLNGVLITDYASGD